MASRPLLRNARSSAWAVACTSVPSATETNHCCAVNPLLAILKARGPYLQTLACQSGHRIEHADHLQGHDLIGVVAHLHHHVR